MNPPPGISAAQLIDLEIAPLEWSVSNLLPEGLALLIGKPKAGKSWLALQLAVAVAEGGSFLHQDIQAVQGDVLYLGMEDGRRRMKSRLEMVLGPKPVPERLTVVTIEDKWPRADQDGMAFVVHWVSEHPEARLIVIDTLGRFRPLEGGRGNAYMADLAALEPLQTLALHRHLTIMPLHHDNKNLKGEDWVYGISGTQAIAGTADTLVGLERRRGSGFALLKLHGRDIDERTLLIQLRISRLYELLQPRLLRSPCGWMALGGWTATGELTAEREAVIAALVAAGEPLSAREIGRRIATEDRTPESGRVHVQRMLAADLLAPTVTGVFFVPSVTPDTPPVTPVAPGTPVAPVTSVSLGISTPPVTIGGGIEKESNNGSMLSDGREIVVSLRDRGLQLGIDRDGRPFIGPSHLVDESDRALLAAHREAVLAALQGESL